MFVLQVGVPEEAMPPTPLGTLIFRNINMTGSLIGSPSIIREMLEVAASQKIHTWVQEWPLEKVNEALVAMEEGKPRYRYVLVNDKHKQLVPQ
jgi:alcohol dehydrogenase (NADP+)